MSDENTTMSEINGTSNGTANGMAGGDPKPAEAAVDVQHREDETAPHKRRARGPRVKVTTAASAATPSVEEPVTTAPMPQESVEATPVEAVTAPQETAAASPAEAPQAASQGSTPPHPATAPHEDLRLRMKVWTDPWTGKRYLMPTAFMRDIKNGQPVSDVMLVYAMRDDDTRIVTLRADEWNTLPFFYFHEDGPAPRASARPPDVIGRHGPR